MKDFFLQLKEKFSQPQEEDDEIVEAGDDYVELAAGPKKDEDRSKVIVRPYIMEDFEDIKPVLDALREGNTVALVNIKPLKDKDLIELKRAVNKLRKTCEAILLSSIILAAASVLGSVPSGKTSFFCLLIALSIIISGNVMLLSY